MDTQRPGNEIIKLVMVTDMDNLLGSGSEDLTNSLVKPGCLFHLTKIRGRLKDPIEISPEARGHHLQVDELSSCVRGKNQQKLFS